LLLKKKGNRSILLFFRQHIERQTGKEIIGLYHSNYLLTFIFVEYFIRNLFV